MTGEPENDPQVQVPEELEGEALQNRAKQLNIKGRSKMTADDLRAAITEAEEVIERENEPQLVSRLIAESDNFLGCPTHVAAGALREYDAEDELPVADAKLAVRNFQAREVTSE